MVSFDRFSYRESGRRTFSAGGEPTWEQVCASPLFDFLKRGEGRKIVEEFKAGNISAGKFAQSIVESYELASTPPPADPAEDFENNLAQSFEDNRKIIEKLRATREPADLEGKLRELRQSHHVSALCSPNGMMKVLRGAAALGLAEGLEEAAEYVLSVRETGKMENTVQVFDVLARAIRALKEKV